MRGSAVYGESAAVLQMESPRGVDVSKCARIRRGATVRPSSAARSARRLGRDERGAGEPLSGGGWRRSRSGPSTTNTHSAVRKW